MGLTPWVTYGKTLCEQTHESLMGRNNVSVSMGHSWENLMYLH